MPSTKTARFDRPVSESTKPKVRRRSCAARLLGRVGQRSGDAHWLVSLAAHGDAAAQEAAVAAVLVPDAVLVLEHLRRADEVRLQRGIETGEIVGMDTVQPFRRAAARGVRGQPDHRAPARRDVELLRLQVPLPESVVGSLGGERQTFAAAPQLVLGARALGDVLPQQRSTAGDRRRCAPARCADRCRLAARRWLSTRVCWSLIVSAMARGRSLRDSAGSGCRDRPAEGQPRRALQQPLERVVPQRDAAAGVVHRHSLLEVLEHFAAAVMLGEAVHVVGVEAVAEAQRHGEHRRDVPHAAIDDLHHGDRHAGAEEVHGVTGQGASRPGPVDAAALHQRDDHFGKHRLREVIGEDRGGNRQSQPRPQEHVRDDAPEPGVGEIRALDRRDRDAGVEQCAAAAGAPHDQARRQGRRGGDDHRHVGALEQQGREDDHEGRRHDGAVRRRRMLRAEAGRQHCGQREPADFNQAGSRRPARQPRRGDRGGEHPSKNGDGGTRGNGSHGRPRNDDAVQRKHQPAKSCNYQKLQWFLLIRQCQITGAVYQDGTRSATTVCAVLQNGASDESQER